MHVPGMILGGNSDVPFHFANFRNYNEEIKKMR